MPRPLTVQITELNFDGTGMASFYPYVWAQLKSYHDRYGASAREVSWLDPLFGTLSPRALFDGLPDERIDVLGVSGYYWNWRQSMEFAALVRERWPEALVVVGGPEADYRAPDFFVRYPMVDVVVLRDGEIPFSAILDRLCDGRRDFHDVPGLCLPAEASAPGRPRRSGESTLTAAAVVPTVFPYSPYEDQIAYYERIAAAHGPGKLFAIWETNRGCPYSCAFCDWGSSTMSRVRPFDMDRVVKDLDVITRVLEPHFLFLADANLGILPRDLEIADLLVRSAEATGYPKDLCYCAAKNNPGRVATIAKRIIKSRLAQAHTLAIQHTNREVLTATDRWNISNDQYLALLKDLAADGVPVEPQLIVGIPGDTVERWKDCLVTLMDWGLHSRNWTFPYLLVPNAPSAEPDFQERFRIRTNLIRTDVTGRTDRLEPRSFEARIAVSTSTYDETGWVDMRMWSAALEALHFNGLLRMPAIYLRRTHGISFRSFYDAVVSEFLAGESQWSQLVSRMRELYVAQSTIPGAVDWMEVEDLPELRLALAPGKWLFVKACMQLETFLWDVSRFLEGRFPGGERLRSCVDYGAGLLLLPDYDPAVGKSFPTQFDWPDYFRQSSTTAATEPLPEPMAVSGARVAIRQSILGRLKIERLAGGDRHRWCQWIDRWVGYELGLDEVSVERSQALPPTGLTVMSSRVSRVSASPTP